MKGTVSTLHYIPPQEISRLLKLPCSARVQTELFAAACRINTLYMIARAGSGHIGSSFSSLDIVSWLYLEELRGAGKAAGRAGDVFFSSKGHDAPGFYAVLIGLGLLDPELLHGLRR